jgi:hypothetical protein
MSSPLAPAFPKQRMRSETVGAGVPVGDRHGDLFA